MDGMQILKLTYTLNAFFKGRMSACSLDLIYGDCSVKCFNETYIILKEEETND